MRNTSLSKVGTFTVPIAIWHAELWKEWLKQKTYWTPGLGRIGPIKYGLSVHASVLPSVGTFSRNWLISFFWNLAWCKGPIYRCVWQPDFLQIWQKWPKNMVSGHFKKITSLVLSGICIKWKFLWFINILRKLHAWE